MRESIKWITLSIIPLAILIAIMVSTWNWWNKEEYPLRNEIYRINDYQNHEPIVSWNLLVRKDWWYYSWEYSMDLNATPIKKRQWFWVMYYPDWCILTGNWVNGIIEWYWTYDCNEGIYYWEFKNNKINWKWILKNKDNSYYSWEWSNEEPNWYWILKYADWEIYEGYWLLGSKHWSWKYTMNDWSIYEWQFTYWKKSGKWKMIYSDWTIQEWIRVDDEFQEPITSTTWDVTLTTWDNVPTTWGIQNEADHN